MKKIVFLTGAGMSVESGFKTFRGSDGLWEDYPVDQVATHEAWENNPALVTAFYNMLRQKLFKAQPNEGHRLIQQLEKDYDVVVVTQNVDNLHEKAGSKKVLHLHGELTKVTSSRHPDDESYQIELTEDNPTVEPGTKARDGSLLRPFIVFFNEGVPMLSVAIHEVQQADILVIIGTSLNVYPAAGLVLYASAKCHIYLIDPEPVSTPSNKTIHFIRKGASEGMKEFIERLNQKY